MAYPSLTRVRRSGLRTRTPESAGSRAPDSGESAVDATWRVAVPAINLHLVGEAALLDDPYAFPANGDVAGLPAAYIINSEIDSLRASGEAFARQLAEASVDVVVETEAGTQHGHLDQPLEPHGARSMERIVRWIRSRELSTN